MEKAVASGSLRAVARSRAVRRCGLASALGAIDAKARAKLRQRGAVRSM
jgi:hypothetical protein